MKNKDCNLVRDLLPNYIENLTNNDTNLFIENHLKDCSECSNILATMKDGENKNEENKSKQVRKEGIQPWGGQKKCLQMEQK